MILPDHEIRRLCRDKAMVSPYNEDHLNPASLDVCLGNRIMLEVQDTPEYKLFYIDSYSQCDPYWIKPGEFFLAETQELFNMPDHVGAQFVLKSSRAREGWDHAEAGWCDPGWYGSRLTMEIKHARRYHPLPIWPGLRIGQMKFLLISGQPDFTYAKTGRYNANLSVTPSKG